jgi:hypothetical protein
MYSLHKSEYRIFKLIETTIRNGSKVESRKMEEMNK